MRWRNAGLLTEENLRGQEIELYGISMSLAGSMHYRKMQIEVKSANVNCRSNSFQRHAAVIPEFPHGHAESLFEKMLQKQEFESANVERIEAELQKYTDEGMEESEFNEAEADLIDLVNEYEQYDRANLEVDDEDMNEDNEQQNGVIETGIQENPLE